MTITARIPPRVEQALAEYCVQRGLSKSEVIVDALEAFLNPQNSEASVFALAEAAGFIACVDQTDQGEADHKARVSAAIASKHRRA